ncbi:hypothetical protein RJ641_021073, partial [Dillenia turbinata]
MKSCPVKTDDCNNLPKKYKLWMLTNLSIADILVSVHHTMTLSFHPVSSNSYRKLYKNSPGIKCYNRASCKQTLLSLKSSVVPKSLVMFDRIAVCFCFCFISGAGALKYMKMEWRVIAISNAVQFVSL